MGDSSLAPSVGKAQQTPLLEGDSFQKKQSYKELACRLHRALCRKIDSRVLLKSPGLCVAWNSLWQPGVRTSPSVSSNATDSHPAPPPNPSWPPANLPASSTPLPPDLPSPLTSLLRILALPHLPASPLGSLSVSPRAPCLRGQSMIDYPVLCTHSLQADVCVLTCHPWGQ